MNAAKGAITSWSCNPATNGLTAAPNLTDYVLGPGGHAVTELGRGASGNMQWQHTNVWADGALIATYDPTGLHFYLNDWLGTRRVQTDYAGVVQQTCTNMPYGNGLTCGNSLESPTENHFTGKQRDSETGNDYFGARYYSSDAGRFLTPDPLPWIAWQNGSRTQQRAFEAHLANPQDLNMYSYVLDNPLSKTDPTGMNACGTKNDSSCTVTVTLQDRTKGANGQYNDKWSNLKGNGDYNATATVTVRDRGKVIATGQFLASTVPSGKGYATIQDGTYHGTWGFHDGHPAILLNGGGPVPVVGGIDPATGKSYATQIFVHIAGWPESRAPLGLTGMTHGGKPISAGCQLICTVQYSRFESLTGLNASPHQNIFTVTVDTSENQ